MEHKKITYWKLFVILSAIVGLLFTMNSAFGQFDYYNPYSNSNIDYFPANPIDTSSRRTSPSPGTSGISPSSKPVPPPPKSPPQQTPAIVQCSNKPKQNPQNTRSVEIRDADGKVFYLSPPKEEVSGVRAYPETSQKIFRIIYGDSGMQKDETEIGLITVDNNCFPKYGYIQNAPIAEHTKLAEDQTVPLNRTAAILDPATGKVYNKKTGELISDARYDAAAAAIYYKDTNSTFGKVFTETTGYVNIEVTAVSDPAPPPVTPPAPLIAAKGCTKKTALLFNEQQPYSFCYHSDAIVVGIMPYTADLKMASSDGPVSVLNITYYKNSATVDDLMKNWYRVKKKKVKNKYRVSGFTYELRDADPSSPPHNGAFLINTKSGVHEFVHIQFTDAPDNPPKPFRFPKEFKKLIETFRF